MSLRELEPTRLWDTFADICSIPHPSGHEERLRDYILVFAAKHGLESRCDVTGNVQLKAEASPGCANIRPVILQGHLDMVPEKNSNYDFDFLTQPIHPVISGDLVLAENTTLGADNGIGVSIILTVMTDPNIKHGPLHAVFTVEEEIGLTGADNVDPGFIDADILINLDSEDEGHLFIGCAGGARLDFTLEPERDFVPENYQTFKIKICGLCGGHSGCDIHAGRANAIKEAAALMRIVSNEIPDYRLTSLTGGDLDNAIPREAFINISVPVATAEKLELIVAEFFMAQRNKHSLTDPNYEISLKKTAELKQAFAPGFAGKLIQVMDECPNGVIAESHEFPGVVETSTNLASAKEIDGKLMVTASQRSLIDEARDNTSADIMKHFQSFGFVGELRNKYPGWTPSSDSKILKTAIHVYEKQTGKKPEIVVIHAGLECGIIGKKHPGIDMISFGPDINGPHAPGENVSISSTQRTLAFLRGVLENIPSK